MRVRFGWVSRVLGVTALVSVMIQLPTPTTSAGAAPASPAAIERTSLPERSFFASVATRSTELAALSKWRATLARYGEERRRFALCDSPFRPCQDREWLVLIKALQAADPATQLVLVTRALNARAYVSDLNNWGVSDYWQTPGEFLARAGDCEDYAIAKFLALRESGWSEDELRIAVVKDESRGIGHAVLIASRGGKARVLDNLTDAILDAEEIDHYRPLFSFNETAWWWHQPTADGRPGETTAASR